MHRRYVTAAALFLCSAGMGLCYDWNTNPGNGTEADPYQISEPAHLTAINDIDTTGVYFDLTNDIDLDPNLPGNQVFSGALIDVMEGHLAGRGFAIRHLTIEQSEPTNSGLIAFIGETGCVRDLRVEDVSITAYGGWSVGALAGENEGMILNCHTSGQLQEGLQVGGLVGRNGDWNNHLTSFIANSTSSCTITGGAHGDTGGLTSYNTGSIFQCSFSGWIDTTYNGAGGLIGMNHGVVNRSFSTATINPNRASGLITFNNGLVRNCFALGTISGFNSESAGLVGIHRSEPPSPFEFGRIENCYAACDLIGGGSGLVGGSAYEEIGATLTSFWDADVSGVTESLGGKGLSTVQMKDPNTYIHAGWDVVGETANGAEDIWQVDPAVNNGYPSLLFKPIDGGDGTPANPCIIYTKQQLLDFFNDSTLWDKHIKLIANIDLSGEVFTEIPISQFDGVFDGSGCMITGYSEVPLMDVVGRTGIVKNLYINDAQITRGGAILAVLNVGEIVDCHVSGLVAGGEYAGGLVGINENLVRRCSADCGVTNSGVFGKGCLLGFNNSFGIVEESYSAGGAGAGGFTGGLVGSNWGLVQHCYSTADVAGEGLSGALVGSNEIGAVICCYATGAVEDDKLVGFPEGVIAHSYYGQGTWVETWEGNSWYEEDGHIWTIKSRADETSPALKWQRWGIPVTLENLYGYIPFYRQDPTRDGSPEHPYIFNSEMTNYPADWDKCFVLTDDLDFLQDDCPRWNGPVIPYFNGIFNGDGHVFRNILFENSENIPSNGFFGVLGPDALVRQFGIEADGGYQYRYPGFIAPVNWGTIEESYAKGNVVCQDYGSILTGFNGGTIRDCYAEGCITLEGELEPWQYENGLVGNGLFARNWGEVLNSYSSVDVQMTHEDFLYNGWNEGLVWNCFYNVDLMEPNIVMSGNPLTSEQMKSADSYIGWGDSAWKIADGNDMPRLAWENTDVVWKPWGPQPCNWWNGDCLDYNPIIDPPRTYGGGNGTVESPYILTTAEHLFILGKHIGDCSQYFVLGNDIDLSGQTLPEAVIGYFEGHFNGAGHRIKNLTINSIRQPSEQFGYRGSGIGFFGSIGRDGVVEYLGIQNANIKGQSAVGGLTGINGGTIRRCYAVGDVRAGGIAGGLAGSNSYMRQYDAVTIENCYVKVDITGEDFLVDHWLDSIGGITGVNNGILRNNYAIGTIYADGSYYPVEMHAIAGRSNPGLIENCYHAGNLSDDYGQPISSLSREGFLGWDFVGGGDGNRDVWRMCAEGVDYPRLSWEFSVGGDYACPAGVDLADFGAVAANWLSDAQSEPETFNVACDGSLDGRIDLADVLILADHWLISN